MNKKTPLDTPSNALEVALAALRRDYSKLQPRIRELNHAVTSELGRINIRLYFPAFRQGSPTVSELVDSIYHYIIPFCLPRSHIQKVHDRYGEVSAEDYQIELSQLQQQALNLFKRANKLTNRNGEAGELLLFILTEWLLSAPQLIAKMSLKTNSEMPVHGADGVHVRYCKQSSKLFLYWGESKLYSSVGDGISAAVKSIEEALTSEKLDHEIDLAKRYIDFTGMEAEAKAVILSYLDPFDESYNNRHDITTCLIGFDFDAFENLSGSLADPEQVFVQLAKSKLSEIGGRLTKALTNKGLINKDIEFFFFPVPSVQSFRDLFQNKIGWKES